MKIKFISLAPSHPASPWQKLVALIMGVALLALVLMFAAVLLPLILVGGAYLWWKTRAVRSQLREMQAQMRQMQERARRGSEPQGEVFEGEIIEGEAVRVQESDARIER